MLLSPVKRIPETYHIKRRENPTSLWNEAKWVSIKEGCVLDYQVSGSSKGNLENEAQISVSDEAKRRRPSHGCNRINCMWKRNLQSQTIPVFAKPRYGRDASMRVDFIESFTWTPVSTSCTTFSHDSSNFKLSTAMDEEGNHHHKNPTFHSNASFLSYYG